MYGKTILVVDDDPQILQIIKTMIHKSHPEYKVSTAPTCKEAIEKINSNHYEIVISDYVLPDGNGKIVLCHSSPTALRVGMTGSIIQEDFSDCCDKFISKPFTFEDIKSIIPLDSQ